MTEILLSKKNRNFAFEHKLNRFPNFEVLPHTHSDFEIFYLISGNCDYFVEKTTHHLKQGDILIIRPSELHGITPLSEYVPYERIVFNVTVDFINEMDKSNEILKILQNRPFGTLNKFDSDLFGHNLCSAALDSLIGHDNDIDDIDLASRILLILSEAKNVLKKMNMARTKRSTADKIFDYVNQNLFSEISLKSISEHFFISESQINRIFKKQAGVSVGKYITSKRLLNARYRLRSGESAVNVSEKCGYSDYSVFYRAYKNQFGCSPQQERKKTN